MTCTHSASTRAKKNSELLSTVFTQWPFLSLLAPISALSPMGLTPSSSCLLGSRSCATGCKLVAILCSCVHLEEQQVALDTLPFLGNFFHEYGRRVGMVPRSSLKEGKNSQMVEKRTRTTKTTQTKQTAAHRPSLHHLVVFPLCWVKQVKRKLMTVVNGPEFSNEKHGSAGLCSSKVSRKGSNGLYFMKTSDQRPLHSVAKPWSRCRSGVSQFSNAGCIHIKME